MGFASGPADRCASLIFAVPVSSTFLSVFTSAATGLPTRQTSIIIRPRGTLQLLHPAERASQCGSNTGATLRHNLLRQAAMGGSTDRYGYGRRHHSRSSSRLRQCVPYRWTNAVCRGRASAAHATQQPADTGAEAGGRVTHDNTPQHSRAGQGMGGPARHKRDWWRMTDGWADTQTHSSSEGAVRQAQPLLGAG